MKYLFLSLFLFTNQLSFSQTLKALEKAANEAFSEEDYYTAMVHLADALDIEPENTDLQFKYAEVCSKFNAYELAEKYYSKVINSEKGNEYPLAIFGLGEMKKFLGDYAEATELFERFLRVQNPNHPLVYHAKKELADCKWAKDYEGDTSKEVQIEQLSKKVNTDYSEFAALGVGDTLYYSSHRFETSEAEKKISKNLYSLDAEKGRPMKYSFNDDKKLTAHTSFSTDGNRIYYTICDFVNAGKIRCDLYYKEKNKKDRWKKTPVKLPNPINNEKFTSTQPAIGYDATRKKEFLFFTSDRHGGEGGLDIWFCEVKGKNFGPPQNLIAINTPNDDLTPYFNTPKQTLYFSSNGHQSFGGYDVFRSKKKMKWGKIENLGQPINTSYHDFYYTVNQTGDLAYLSSNRPGSFYIDESNKSCCYDIYKAKILELEEEEEKPKTSKEVTTLIPNNKNNFNKTDITPETRTDENDESTANSNPDRLSPKSGVASSLEDFLPLALYFDNDEPDRRTLRTYTKKAYETTYWKYYDKEQEYIYQFTAPLDTEQSIEATQFIEEFFENKVHLGYDKLLLFSELLLQRLEKGETVEIFIKGFTSPLAKDDYNLNLGKRRVSSLINQFRTYDYGTFRPYIDTGKLILTEVSFGETKAAVNVSDNYLDTRNSIYNIGAAQERRVEIVEIKSN